MSRGQRLRIHARDHRPGGVDPIPFAAFAHEWVYVGTFPGDPHTTLDSPPFQNSWANVLGMDGQAVPARFRISPDDNLEIEGSFGGGISGTVAWTLPAAWRRDYRKVHVASDDDHNIMVVTVDSTTGEVTPYEALTVGATGAVGSSGSTWREGAGAPSSGLGVNGDFYLNTSNGDVYLKSGGSYSVVGNITGPAGATGSTGATGASTAWHDGTGAPSGGLGSNGDYYLNDANGDVYFKSGGSWSVVANIKGATGSTGSAGATGAAGIDGGLKYVYLTSTANTDPGSGKLKFDSVTFSAISSMRISETDGDSNGLASVIQSWDDSSSSVRATVTMVKAGAPSNILILQVAGAVTDNGTWDSFTVNYVGTSGSFANGDNVRIFVSRTGDKGDIGATGATGSTGSTGTIAADDVNAIVAMEVFA